MTIEEHIRAAEHHLTEAYALMKRGGKARQLAIQPQTWRRICCLSLNIRGLLREISNLGPSK